jgi:hypothetical protein
MSNQPLSSRRAEQPEHDPATGRPSSSGKNLALEGPVARPYARPSTASESRGGREAAEVVVQVASMSTPEEVVARVVEDRPVG